MSFYSLRESRTLQKALDVKYPPRSPTVWLRMYPRPAGYSLKCQRNVEDVCHAIGVQDVYAKLMKGNSNPVTLTKAVLWALNKSH